MNKINSLQNNEENLKIQCYARYMYNRAEILNYFIWLVTFISIILNYAKSTIPNSICTIIGITTAIAIYFFNKSLTSTINKAAASRKLFDYTVFQLSNASNNYNGITKEKIILEASKKKNRHNDYFKKQMDNTGLSKIRGVRNWYVGIDDSWNQEKAIKECQRQNSVFDNYLSKIVMIFIIVVGAIACIGFVLAAKLPNNNFLQVLSLFLPFITRSFYSIRRLICYNTYYHEQEALQREHVFDSIEKKQEYIDKRRTMEFCVPDRLYQILSRRIHNDVIESQQQNIDN